MVSLLHAVLTDACCIVRREEPPGRADGRCSHHRWSPFSRKETCPAPNNCHRQTLPPSMLLPHCHCLRAPTLLAVVSADTMAARITVTPLFPLPSWATGAPVVEPQRALLPRKPEHFFPLHPLSTQSFPLTQSVFRSRGRVSIFPSRTILIPHRVPLP
jgi:hypothetical protein